MSAPAQKCNATKQELLTDKKLDLGLNDLCPACKDCGVDVKVAFHRDASASSAAAASVPVVAPSPNPFSSFHMIQQQFDTVVNHVIATAAAAAAVAPPPPALFAPIFQLPPNHLLQLSAAFANQQSAVAQYYQALQWSADQGHLVADDSIRAIPADPIFAQAHSAGDRFTVLPNIIFGASSSSAVTFIMRASALQSFTQQVNQYAQTRPALPNVAAVAAVPQQAINHIQPRMLVLGPQGMGKSYSMEYHVSLTRAAIAVNRVIFIPHCGVWVRSDPLVYLIQCVMVAFHTDQPVIAACNQVLSLIALAAADAQLARDNAVTNLLTFVAMYCQINGLRLYLYADQLNALLEQIAPGVVQDHLVRFPFSILRSTIIPYWSAFGVIVVTAVSANNNILDEVRHFGPSFCSTFLSRYTQAESQVYLNTLVDHGIIQPPTAVHREIFTDYTGLLPLECWHLFEFIKTQYEKQVVPAGDQRSAFSSASWSTLLEEWKQQRMSEFEEMLSSYDDRFLSSELAVGRATTAARALELRLPTSHLSPLFDRRLVFKRRGEAALHEDPGLLYLDSLSPLVRLAMQLHYPPLPPSHSGAASLNDAIGTMLLNTELMTNDAKGRLVEGYILHRIRHLVSTRAKSISIPLFTGGAPWVAGAVEPIKFKFANADIVDFPGDDLPPLAMMGDLTRPKYFIPMRVNYTEFDFFYLKPGRTGLLGKPTVLYRISVTLSLTGHGHHPNRRNLAAWQAVLVFPAGISHLTHAHYAWIAPKNQHAPVTARNASYLLDMDAMVLKGFPLLAFVRLR